MRIAGKRVTTRRLIQTDRYVVAVDVELVIPPDDPSEPCYESETVQFLREVKERAELGDLAWLTQRGKVYAAVATAS
jgi:hypothetical protein